MGLDLFGRVVARKALGVALAPEEKKPEAVQKLKLLTNIRNQQAAQQMTPEVPHPTVQREAMQDKTAFIPELQHGIEAAKPYVQFAANKVKNTYEDAKDWASMLSTKGYSKARSAAPGAVDALHKGVMELGQGINQTGFLPYEHEKAVAGLDFLSGVGDDIAPHVSDLLKKLSAADRKKHPIHYTTKFRDLTIDVENRRNSFRRGVDQDGKPWSTKMKHPYGEFRGTKGVDGDPVDVFVGPDKKSDFVLVVHTKVKGTKNQYDEDKVILGCKNREEALKIFRTHYSNWKDHYLKDTPMTFYELKDKLKRTKKRPRMLDKNASVRSTLPLSIGGIDLITQGLTGSRPATSELAVPILTATGVGAAVDALQDENPGASIGTGLGTLAGFHLGKSLPAATTQTGQVAGALLPPLMGALIGRVAGRAAGEALAPSEQPKTEKTSGLLNWLFGSPERHDEEDPEKELRHFLDHDPYEHFRPSEIMANPYLSERTRNVHPRIDEMRALADGSHPMLKGAARAPSAWDMEDLLRMRLGHDPIQDLEYLRDKFGVEDVGQLTQDEASELFDIIASDKLASPHSDGYSRDESSYSNQDAPGDVDGPPACVDDDGCFDL